MSNSETTKPDPSNQVLGRRIRVRGLVQGVGFRPTVWQLAKACDLVGEVHNDGKGVLIKAWGLPSSLEQFCTKLTTESPPLARVDAVSWQAIKQPTTATSFEIIASQTGGIETGIVPDAATCPECLSDIQSPANRRYRYPFANCTHCGPRLSIIHALPYDRGQTAMAPFPMCPSCQREYDDPADRRFHAQPNACPDCGPQIALVDKQGHPVSYSGEGDIITQCAHLLLDGKIAAIKGIGGFHLACDATNEDAVTNLRARKKRYGKPLALMVKDIAMAERYCHIDEKAKAQLQDRAAPILLLKRRLDAPPLPSQIAPEQNRLGLMLPYSPLHHVLLEDCACPLVMTSGNLSHEPQVIDNDEALHKLASLADAFLLHDRTIINRLDDSVVQEIDGAPTLLRRGRGFAPEPLQLPEGFEAADPVLAAGGEIKNTFCLLSHGQAIVSHHIGDMENPMVQSDYRKALALYREARNFTPNSVAVDMHQGYFATRLGEELAAESNCSLISVQHHHAHIASCMAEYGLSRDHPPILGVALDGLGAGDNGDLWGGEFLLADYHGYKRLAHFDPVALPGGAAASREPWRNSFAHLEHALGWETVTTRYPDLEFVRWMEDRPTRQLTTMITRGLNAPLISSAGRLFDAVAGLLDCSRSQQAFEGQAAMQLQVLAESHDGPLEPYRYQVEDGKDARILKWQPFWQDLLKDLANSAEKSTIAARFHAMLIDAVSHEAVALANQHSTKTIALTGGSFQNRLLAEGVIGKLRAEGFNALIPRHYPANDGGLSLGQAVIAAAQTMGRQKL